MSNSKLNGTKPLVWVVDSAYTGELHARIGVAERLGYGYALIPQPGNDYGAYQHILKERYNNESKGSPLLVISGTGEETTAEIADLRPLFDKRLFNIYLASILPDERHPRLAEYDLIASPQLTGKKVVTLTGVPHQLTRERLTNAYRQHASYFEALPKPIIGVLLGGNTRYCSGFDEGHARQIARHVTKLNSELKGTIVVTNSRRTPENALAALLDQLNGLNFDFLDCQQNDIGLYHALLAHADIFIVTGDSLSMCSEAAFTGKPLLVDLSKNATECFHREIVGRLIDCGAARLLSSEFEFWSYTPPDPTEEVVQEIQVRIQSFFD